MYFHTMGTVESILCRCVWCENGSYLADSLACIVKTAQRMMGNLLLELKTNSAASSISNDPTRLGHSLFQDLKKPLQSPPPNTLTDNLTDDEPSCTIT